MQEPRKGRKGAAVDKFPSPGGCHGTPKVIMQVWECMSLYMCLHVCACACVRACACGRVRVRVRVRVCMCACVCARVCAYVCVCMWVWSAHVFVCYEGNMCLLRLILSYRVRIYTLSSTQTLALSSSLPPPLSLSRTRSHRDTALKLGPAYVFSHPSIYLKLCMFSTCVHSCSGDRNTRLNATKWSCIRVQQ